MSKLKQFIHNSTVTTLLKFVSAGLKFLIIIYVTNQFGASEYGAYTFAMSVFLLINLIFRYGFDVFIQKEAASFELQRKYIKSISQFFQITYFSVISLLLVTFMVEMILYYFSNNIDQLKYQYLSLLLLFSFSYSILWIFTYYYRGIGKGKLSVLNLEIIFPIVQVMSIYILLQFDLQIFQILIYSFVIAIFISLIIYFNGIKNRYNQLKKVSFIKLLKLETKYFRQSYPFLLVSMSSMLLAWTDIYVISYFETNENIGIYSVVTKIGLLILFPASAVSIFFSNKVVEFLQINDYKQLHKYFKIATVSLFIVSMFMFIFINFFSSIILSLFGDIFMSATTVLLLFSLAQLINGTSGVFESIFLMSDLKNILMKLNILMLVVNLMLNIPLVYMYGIKGAAIATLIVISINRLIQYLIIRKRYFVKK